MNKKKVVMAAILSVACAAPSFAGGILTNSNQSIAFIRMLARGAVIDVDGVYTNPAGLAFMNDGFHLSLNWQNAYQERNATTRYALFPETNNERFYKGTASAPIIPSLYGVYKKDKLALSGFFGVVGGGGKASYDNGLPLFDSQVMAGIASNQMIQNIQKIAGVSAASDLYKMATAMQGRQYIFGLQIGASYQFADWFSAYAGARMNYFSGGYKGYVTASLDPALMNNAGIQAYLAQNPAMAQQVAQLANTNLVDLRLNCDQTGWGLAPIIGADFKLGKLNVGMKYEFKANLNLENNTKENSDPEGALAAFRDGVNTPSDVPALFAAAVQYEILPTLRAAVEYHFYDDKHAGMAGHKEKALTHGTNEVLVGAEWDVHKRVSLSAGYQKTNYGLSDNFQSDTSFFCDSYSVGFGGAIKLNDRAKVNIAYFWTTYDDYHMAPSDNFNNTTLFGQSTYSRTNKVFGVGLDYTF